MYKRKFIMFFWLCAVIMIFTGCATVSSDRGMDQASLLPERVNESFHPGITDPETIELLNNTDVGNLAPAERAEYVILHALAGVERYDETAGIFSILWSREDARDLFGEDLKGDVSPGGAALLYYILSSDASSAWRIERAEGIYKRNLHSLTPSDLKGYSLHFYTLALLRSGRVKEAMPFLERLEMVTPPRLYLEDLRFALKEALFQNSVGAGIHIASQICRVAGTNGLDLPDRDLVRVVERAIRQGQEEVLREVLLKTAREHGFVRGYRFAELILSALEQGNGSAPPAGGNPDKRVKGMGSVPAGKVLIEVQLIEATRRFAYLDPALATIGDELLRTLNHTGFTLLDREVFVLGMGEDGEMFFRGERKFIVGVERFEGDNCILSVSIKEKGNMLFQTKVRTVNEGVTVLGNPGKGADLLLIRIKSRFNRDSGEASGVS